MCRIYERRRDLLVEALRSVGMHVDPPQGTIYLWVPVPDGYTSASFTQQLLDQGSDRADEAVSVAKAMTTLATTLSVQEGIQMHGGIGMTDEYDIGFYMKRARVLAEMFGDANFHADRLAIAAGY